MTQWSSIFSFALKLGAAFLAAFLVIFVTDLATFQLRPELRPSRFDIVRGAQIFESRCSVCHSDAEGDLSRLGPNLGNIGAVAASRREHLNGPEYILESIMKPGEFAAPVATAVLMSENIVADLSEGDIRNLVARVSSLGAIPNDEEIAALVIEKSPITDTGILEIRRDLIDRAEHVFRERCQGCHSLHNGNEYLVFAPSVFGVGSSKGKTLRDAILHVNSEVPEKYRTSVVTLANGATLTGFVIRRTSDELVVMSMQAEDQGRIVTVRIADVRKGPYGELMIADIGRSPRATAVSEELTPDEIDALVVLLKALN